MTTSQEAYFRREVPRALTPDEAYGGDYKFRTWLEDRRIGYVVAVPKNQTIPVTAGSTRADHLVAHAPQQAWKRLSCGGDCPEFG